jgi:type VI secretion system protein ImpF
MAGAELRDRLQPALLDRLVDEAPGTQKEADTQRLMSKQQMRAAVLRDLSWLFNATQMKERVVEAYPALADSVLNYGLPALSGQEASKVDIGALERTIRQAILRFEPRILPESLEVKAIETDNVLDTHNMIEFQIRGHLWAQPVPLEILLRTQVDLEAGLVSVRDNTGSAPIEARR